MLKWKFATCALALVPAVLAARHLPAATTPGVPLQQLTLIQEQVAPRQDVQKVFQNESYAQVTSGNFPDSVTSGNFPDSVTAGNFPDAITSGNFPNGSDSVGNFPAQVTSGNFPDQITAGNFPDQVTAGNFPDQITSGRVESDALHLGFLPPVPAVKLAVR